MKDKNLTAILAFFGGAFGLHRFYLGQVGRGVLSCIFMPIAAMIGVIDAIIFLSMDEATFDAKYNADPYDQAKPRRRPSDRYDRYRQRERERRRDRGVKAQRQRNRGIPSGGRAATPTPTPARSNRKTRATRKTRRGNTKREEGIRFYKEFEYDNAIEAFEASLREEPGNIATHWNLACCYSLTEDTDKAIYHIDRAVAMGFDDFSRIKEHDALAYLRVQPEYLVFEKNGFRLSPNIKPEESPEKEEADLLSQPLPSDDAPPRANTDLLDQLQRLGDLREKGLLTEAEFAAQKRKLLQ